MQAVNDTLSDLGVEGTRVVRVFNKMDLVTEPAVLKVNGGGTVRAVGVRVGRDMGEIEDLIGRLRTTWART